MRRNPLAVIIAMMNARFDNLNLTELSIFLVIAEREGLSVSSVARLSDVSDATASRTIRRLTAADAPGALAPARGLVWLARGREDGRTRFAFLTPAGQALRDAINAVVSKSDWVEFGKDFISS